MALAATSRTWVAAGLSGALAAPFGNDLPVARRIVLVIGSTTKGGAERVAATLANAWAEQGRTVWILSSFLGARGSFYKLHAGVSLLYLADGMARQPRDRWLAALYKLRALRRLILRINPDVTLSFLTNVNIMAIAAQAGLKVPLVVSERTDTAGDVDKPLSLRLARVLSYPLADALVVQTAAAAERYGKRLRGVAPIVVIPNPLPDALMTSSVRAGHARSGGTVIAMGRLSAEKGYAALIQAFRAAFAGDPTWCLQIWGEGPLRTQLQAEIDAVGLTGRIQLCGQTEEPWAALAAAQIFVMTSQYEGFPNAMLEAMALGLPCIAFDCPTGPSELADEGRTAVIVPLNDIDGLAEELRKLAANRVAREQLGLRAAAFVREQLSEAIVLAKWDAIFGEILSRDAPAAPSSLQRG